MMIKLKRCDEFSPRSFFVDHVFLFIVVPSLSPNARWSKNGVTVAGGNGQGNAANQLYNPSGLDIDEGGTVFIADSENHRIMAWKRDATTGEVVAGGRGQGNELNQLNYPSDVLIDRETDSLLICDRGNRRVTAMVSS